MRKEVKTGEGSMKKLLQWLAEAFVLLCISSMLAFVSFWVFFHCIDAQKERERLKEIHEYRIHKTLEMLKGEWLP